MINSLEVRTTFESKLSTALNKKGIQATGSLAFFGDDLLEVPENIEAWKPLITELKSDLNGLKDKEKILDKRSEWIDWIGQHHKDVEEYRKVTDTKMRRKILDIYVDKVEISYDHEIQQHNIKLNYRYPLVNDGIEYTRDKDSKVKWDKWGKSYRIKKGDQVVSLSDLQSSTFGVGKPYSTVTQPFR